MIAPHCHSRDWIEAQRESLAAADAEILERAIFALTLLSALSRTDLDFVFKGGTSLLLHLPKPQRLSIDIDIVCDTDRETLARVLDEVLGETPFTRWEEQDRGADRLPKRVHFKFYYPSPTLNGEERPILLDVVTEPNRITDLVEKPIRTAFIECSEESFVTTPSVNALLGDKMTAFAPNTIGVPLNERYSLQVIKQLFDIGQLYDVVTNTVEVSEANRSSFQAECVYRGHPLNYETYLDDIVETCHLLCTLELRGFRETEATGLLRRGIRQLPNHLIGTRFRLPQAKVAAGKAALLASILTQGDMPPQLPQFVASGVEALRESRLIERFKLLERLKPISPESFFYWQAINQ